MLNQLAYGSYGENNVRRQEKSLVSDSDRVDKLNGKKKRISIHAYTTLITLFEFVLYQSTQNFKEVQYMHKMVNEVENMRGEAQVEREPL